MSAGYPTQDHIESFRREGFLIVRASYPPDVERASGRRHELRV